MNYQITEEQRMILDSLKAFLEKEIYPHEAEADRAGEVPVELGEHIKQQAIEMGFYAANLPESVGGGGLDYTTLGLMERDRYLLPCVSGEKHESFALTEPGAGSDIMAMTTRADRDGDDYIINGAKHFISTPCVPDFSIVFVVTGMDETPRGPRKRVTAFLVDAGEKGFDMQRGPTCAAHLGEEGKGLELADKWLSMGRVWVGAQCCGKMELLLELAAEWAATRKQFGKPIGRFQGTSFKLADMATELQASDLLVMHACEMADQGKMTSQDAAMAKLFASEALGRAADHTVQIYGGMGLMEELPIERLWRDSRLERIWDGTSEIQRHIISRTLLREYGG
jgi:acyl-CoA dehydrogenase